MAVWSRRDVLRATASATVIAVPMTALGGRLARAGSGADPGAGAGAGTGAVGPETLDDLAGFDAGQVIFSVHDAARGEVAIYHGRHEVIVQDPNLVARILRASRNSAGTSGQAEV